MAGYNAVPPTRRLVDRRDFLGATAAGMAGTALAGGISLPVCGGQDAATATVESDARSTQPPVRVLMPRDRVPVSFIIDDSTCLVNMGHFCTPQFAAARPDRAEYQKPWRTWPREIPDQFVREFGEWCAEQGVKGKYSIVPNPACVGWLDRELPGWSRPELQASLNLVRELMLPNWDIHPEMITHTRVIDLNTGRPLEPVSAATMENSYPQEPKSVDELAAYLAYALRILSRCGLPCEGITTPGGFGNAVKQSLPQAVDEAVRDVFQTELPHYFKYVRSGSESTEPVAEYVRGIGTDEVRLTMNVPAGTGDWFGGWQGDQLSDGDRYLSADGTRGRMAELIERRQPAVMLCHWPGMYCNGTGEGFKTFQSIVNRLHDVWSDRIHWMKVSEIARYWAAKQLTGIKRFDGRVTLQAPFAAREFTIEIERATGPLTLESGNDQIRLQSVADRHALRSGTCFADGKQMVACFDLPRGTSTLEFTHPA